jgi:hypothetical protein
MYKKDLTRSIHLRLSESDMQFLLEIKDITNNSICETIREFIRVAKYSYNLGIDMEERKKNEVRK